MRITNSIILNGSQTNINKNKNLINKLNTQMTTQKKISKPSDDPIVAIRALRLRNNLDQLNQYYEKNIPDAQSWMQVTEDAMVSMRTRLQNAYYSFNQGANEDLSTTELQAILDELKANTDGFYDEGNASCAGRSLFTGYKTNTSLCFKSAEENTSYSITEKLTGANVETFTYVSGCTDLDKTNIQAVAEDAMPQTNELHRIRLSYDELDSVDSFTYTKNDGTQVTVSLTEKSLSVDGDDAYLNVAAAGANYIKETGEIILGEDIYRELENLKSADAIEVSYKKTGFSKGDVRPEMYFDCENLTTGVQYEKEVQDIAYTVTFNQSLKVNTEASDIFDFSLRRDVDELQAALTETVNAEKKKAEIESMLEDSSYSTADKAKIETMLEAAEKEVTLKRAKVQQLFEAGIDNSQAYQERVNLGITDVGNRTSRLKLIESRMADQQLNFEDLKEANEGVNIEDVAIELTAANTIYEGSLASIGAISKLSLLNYI